MTIDSKSFRHFLCWFLAREHSYRHTSRTHNTETSNCKQAPTRLTFEFVCFVRTDKSCRLKRTIDEFFPIFPYDLICFLTNRNIKLIKMPVVQINDISVDFPFEPYDVQKEYMAKIIESLQKGQHAILESPSGNLLALISLQNIRLSYG